MMLTRLQPPLTSYVSPSYVSLEEKLSQKLKIDSKEDLRFRQVQRSKCCADFVIRNVLPYLVCKKLDHQQQILSSRLIWKCIKPDSDPDVSLSLIDLIYLNRCYILHMSTYHAERCWFFQRTATLFLCVNVVINSQKYIKSLLLPAKSYLLLAAERDQMMLADRWAAHLSSTDHLLL